ncbi:hypothetical protein TL16_g07533, partial [Triparma laevis f. inornata]|uniref:Large ribosomal subunit protein eL14 domain-containing protein n=2 Tax=Triparma laevis TaxID=1534972 RepID=A0A9W7FCR0_9STRA
MVFTRFVEVGRVCMINYGKDKGKLATIVDIVDGNKCLIDGCNTGVTRQIITFRRIALTDLTCEIGRGARAATIKAAWKKGEVAEAWAKSSWAKKLAAKAARGNTSDFDRFKIMVARKQKSKIVAAKVKSM